MLSNTKKYFSSDKISLIFSFIVMCLIFSFMSPYFLTEENSINILISASLMGLVAIGETYLLIAGLVDLSPGAVAAFASMLVAVLLKIGVPVVPSIILAIISGIIVGIINSIIVNKLEIEPFIATLATMTIFRGLAFIISDGKPIFISNEAFLMIGKDKILGLPIPVIILLVVFICFGIILKNTKFGRNVYVVGGNKKAAFLAGLNPEKMTLFLYMITGALSALGGIILTARLNSGQPASNIGLEFDAITAAVLGGTAFTGGVGTIFGTFLGVLILQGFNNGLLILNVPSFWQYVARGLLLLIALMFDFIRKKNRIKM